MSQRANPAVVGGFVVGALVLLVAGVLLFGSGTLLRERVPVVAFFSGNVRGLQEGSAVEFRGVRVGTVKHIRLLLETDSNELLIPVHMELEPHSLTFADSSRQPNVSGAHAFLDMLVEHGLRARLDMKSFVTGQLTVGLDMRPGTKITRVGALTNVYELPTVPSTLDRVVGALQELPLQEVAAKLIATLDRASALLENDHLNATLRDAAGAAAQTRRLMHALTTSIGPVVANAQETMREARRILLETSQQAGATLTEYKQLANNTEKQVGTLARKLERTLTELAGIRESLDARITPVTDAMTQTLGEANGAFANARNLLAEDSRTHYNLNIALEELAAAARSLRIMANYLEQNPDALLKGKGL
jgi:paraquat-inducible protein B